MGIFSLFKNKGKHKKYTDEELIAMIQANGIQREKAIYYLHDQYLGYVLQAKEKYRLTEDQAVEVYGRAIVYLDKYLHSGKFRREATIASFLYTIMHSRCLDLLRKLARERQKHQALTGISIKASTNSTPNKPQHLDNESSLAFTPSQAKVIPIEELNHISDKKINIETRMIGEERVQVIMQQLPPKGRAVLLDYAEGYSIAEIMQRHAYRNKRTATASVFNYKQQLLKIIRKQSKTDVLSTSI